MSPRPVALPSTLEEHLDVLRLVPLLDDTLSEQAAVLATVERLIEQMRAGEDVRRALERVLLDLRGALRGSDAARARIRPIVRHFDR